MEKKLFGQPLSNEPVPESKPEEYKYIDEHFELVSPPDSNKKTEEGIAIEEENAKIPQTPEEILESKINSQYENDFGIKAEELKNIEGYESLSVGQKAVVFHDLAFTTLQEIKEAGIKKHREEMKEKASFSPYDRLGKKVFSAPAVIAQKIWRGGLRKFYIAKAETLAAEEIEAGGFEARKEFLKDLVKMVRDNDFGADVDEKGEIKTNYASKLEKLNLSPSEKLIVERFNTAANDFVNMPRPIPGREAVINNLTEIEFKEAKRDIIELIRDKKITEEEKRLFKKTGNREMAQNGVKGEMLSLHISTLQEVANMEKGIQMARFFNANPDAIKEISEIKSQKFWKYAILNGVTERIGYSAGGYFGNMLLAGAMSIGAAPLLAALSGGTIAWKRSLETLRQETILAKAGGESRVLEKMEKQMGEQRGLRESGAKMFVEAEELSAKIENIADRLRKTEDPEKKAELRGLLDRRLYYTRYIVERDMIGYSSQKDRLAEQLTLAEKMAEGEAWLLMGDKTVNKKIQEHIDKTFALKSKEIKKAKREYIAGQINAGIIIGATFAFLGGQARNLIYGGHSGGRAAVEELTKQKGVNTGQRPDTADVLKPGMPTDTIPVPMKSGSEIERLMNQPLVEQPTSAPSVIEKGGITETIGKNGNIWRAFQKIAKEVGLSRSELSRAINDPQTVFKMPDGREIPLIKMGLIQPEDKITFVPGVGGKSSHFELIDTSKDVGDNRMLYEHIIKTHSKPPQWLRDIFESKGPATQTEITSADIHPMEPMPLHPYGGNTASHAAETINHPASSRDDDLPSDFLDHKPQIPEVEAGTKPVAPFEPPHAPKPAVEHLAEVDKAMHEATKARVGKQADEILKKHPENIPKTGFIVERVGPGELKIKGEGIEGVIKFNYDNPDHILNFSDTHFKELLGTETLKDNYLGILRDKTIVEHVPQNISLLRDKMRGDSTELYKYLKVFENISKDPKYGKETTYIAKAIKDLVESMTKKYGDVIDLKQVPEALRGNLK